MNIFITSRPDMATTLEEVIPSFHLIQGGQLPFTWDSMYIQSTGEWFRSLSRYSDRSTDRS